MDVASSVAMPVIKVFVSVANNFVNSSAAADHGYHPFRELAGFIDCLLQKIKKSSSVQPVEQWEEHVVGNHSWFPAIDGKDFLSGTRVMAALDEVGSQYLRTEFRRDARRFLEEFVNCLLSTVASISLIRQGIFCFCPAIVVGGDDVAPFQLFNKLLDGSEIEACRAVYQRFVQEQRQLELSCTRSRPDVGDVLLFCSAQAGFSSNHACSFALS